jgi:CRP-like cAMP-binding protein
VVLSSPVRDLAKAKVLPKLVSRTGDPLCGPRAQSNAGNRLLSALSNENRERLLANARHVDLKKNETLYEPDDSLGYAYFPTSGLLSIVVPMHDGNLAAVASIGCEGMYGFFLLLEESRSGTRCVVESPGSAWKIDRDTLVERYAADEELRSILEHYITFQFVMIAQFSACNLLHSLKQRLANWLLRCERLDCVDLQVTHEFLSQLFGVQRTTLTSTLKKFQQRGLIRAKHGHLTILDPDGLQGITCECFARWLSYMPAAIATPSLRKGPIAVKSSQDKPAGPKFLSSM